MIVLCLGLAVVLCVVRTALFLSQRQLEENTCPKAKYLDMFILPPFVKNKCAAW